MQNVRGSVVAHGNQIRYNLLQMIAVALITLEIFDQRRPEHSHLRGDLIEMDATVKIGTVDEWQCVDKVLRVVRSASEKKMRRKKCGNFV